MPTQRAAFISFFTLLLFSASSHSYAQRLASFDSFPSINTLVKQQLDSIKFQPGKTLSSLKPDSAKGLLPSFSTKQYNPFKNIKDSSGKVKVKFQGGFISYNMSYRSLIDTPLMEKDILQHTINGNANVAVGYFPLQVNYLVRKTNSAFFRDLVDVQVNLDVQKFQQHMIRGALDNLHKKIASLQDEATGALSQIMLDKYLRLQNDFSASFNAQKLTEARQMLNIPELSIDRSLPDSQARKKSDSLRAKAADYIKLYDEYGSKLAAIKSVSDSLKTQYAYSVKKVNQLKQLLKGNIPDMQVLKKLAQDSLVKSNGITLLPKKYQWLLGIRRLSLGRTPVNYSDLTAKNLSLNGINVEYNNRFYFALTAGLVNYRFRDFNIRSAGRPKQYFVMGRLGVGTINRSYIIASVFNGTKQIFASGYIGNLYTVRTTGMSIEGRYQLSRYNYLKAEIAQTFAPDFRNNPPEKSKWTLSDKTNKAYMLGGHFEYRKMQAKIDGSYKYTGANFQSFSNFQTNAAQHIWNIKAEKYFFRKHLRLTGAIKSNEFSNPYLVQSYSSNTIFKSLQATFRKKKWPTVSAGYMPMTQLSDINGQLTENRFNSLNANVYHTYNISRLKTASSIVFSRFYNNSSDSGFIYFNAKNILVSQQFYFPSYTASINYYRSSNNAYRLNVMEESFQVPLRKQHSVMVGAKIYSLERVENKVGVYGNIQFAAGKAMQLRIQWEEGYIPGINGNLVKNRIGNIQLTKNF